MINKRYSRLFDITENSMPVYDAWGFGDYWQCADWVLWHKKLVAKKSKEQADKIWIDAWLAGLSKVSGGYGTAPGSGYIWDSVPIDCRTFNSEFRSYIQKSENKALYAAVYSGIGGLIATPLGWAADVGTAVGAGAKTIKHVIPLLIIAAAVIATIWAYNKYAKTGK